MKISIITICYNSEKCIRECVESVVSQDYSNIEYIVIDGGSTDNTLSILFEYSGKISRLLSEKDSGISDAMNKGLKCSTGKFVLFLHSDDFLLFPGSITNAVKIMDMNLDINAFSVLYGNGNRFVKQQSRKFNFLTYLKTPIKHQGALCKKSLFKKIGLFDDDYKIAMDYDFFLRAYISNASLKCFSMPLSFMRNTGVSSKKDWVNTKKRFLEEKRIHYKNSTTLFIKVFYFIYWILYKYYRYLLYRLKSI